MQLIVLFDYPLVLLLERLVVQIVIGYLTLQAVIDLF